MVERVAGARQAAQRRRCVERIQQRRQRAEIQLRVAPVQLPQRREAVGLDRLHDPGVEPADVLGGAERAVLHVPAGAAGDLADLVRVQRAPLAAVELVEAGERHVAEVHVQAHADRIGRDQVVDLAGLVEGDLGVAGARAERAQHHGGTAAPPPHQLGERVDLLGSERHHGAAPRQAGDLGRRGVGERREARPGHHLGLGHQQLSSGRIVSAPRNMVSSRPRARSSRSVKTWPRSGSAHSWISSTARKLTSRSDRHRLDRGDEVARASAADALLAGDQGDRAGALLRDDPVVDLARQQPQRKADHPAAMGEHPLDREVGLAGVGRPEHREHACSIVRHQRHELTMSASTHQ